MGLPYEPMLDPDSQPGDRAKPRWRVPTAGLLVLASLALAALTGAGGGFGHWRHGRVDPEEARAHAAFAVERLLGKVDASAEQTVQIQAIVDRSLVDLLAFKEEQDDFHTEVLAALTGEAIDRAGLEALRSEKLASFDAVSQQLVAAIADVGEVLTPAQRGAIAEHVSERHGHRGGWRH
jgi:protein CpxP